MEKFYALCALHARCIFGYVGALDIRNVTKSSSLKVRMTNHISKLCISKSQNENQIDQNRMRGSVW